MFPSVRSSKLNIIYGLMCKSSQFRHTLNLLKLKLPTCTCTCYNDIAMGGGYSQDGRG